MQDIVEKSTRRILIVDDDQLLLRAASRLAKRDPRIELLSRQLQADLRRHATIEIRSGGA